MSEEQLPPDPSQTALLGSFFATAEPDKEVPKQALSSADQQAVDALPPGSALLVVQHGPNAGARFLLDTERTTAGRHPRSDIFLDDVTVSRKHCEFVANKDGFLVRDIGSLNGTYVNRERIESHELQAADEVQIGKFRLAYYPSNQGGAGK